jgi:hypothetical protein
VLLALVTGYCIRQLLACAEKIQGPITRAPRAGIHDLDIGEDINANGENPLPHNAIANSSSLSDDDHRTVVIGAPLPTYSEIAFFAYGRKGKIVCSLFILPYFGFSLIG